jgi:hypothetical protein
MRDEGVETVEMNKAQKRKGPSLRFCDIPDRIRRGEHRAIYFFLCLFFLNLFLRLCVAILCLFLFLPQGIISIFCYIIRFSSLL